MARSHGIAIVLTIVGGVGIWLWGALASTPVAPPLPPSAAREDAPEPGPVEPAVDSRAVQRTAPTPAAPAPEPAAAPPVPPAAAPPSAPAAPITAQVLVRDVATRGPVAEFRWSFQPGGGASPVRGTGKDGRADLLLPFGSQGALLIEALGYGPERVPLTLPALSSAPTPVDVFLARNTPASGVSITARDDQGEAIARLRIDCWQLAAGAVDPARDADPEAAPLWSRIGTGEGGVFRLPELPAARFALRVQPVDEQGEALPLLPWRTVFSFAGNEAVPLVADFAQGMVLVLTADADGQSPIELGCTLRRGRDVVSALWRSRPDAQAAGALAQDLVTLPGRAATALAVPIGDYQIELRNGAAQVTAAFAAGDLRVRRFTTRVPR